MESGSVWYIIFRLNIFLILLLNLVPRPNLNCLVSVPLLMWRGSAWTSVVLLFLVCLFLHTKLISPRVTMF